jgi:hypothetical protein
MILTSRLLNFLTFGSLNETFCSRIFRRWARGCNVSGLFIALINYGFWVINEEVDHVYQSYVRGKK